ncbi:MAG: hypothetical protein PT941_01465 [Bacillales bacterium]|nr:hypothetical protein [Bacillales bacterium]
MNRGFKTYYKEGRKVAKRMYKTKGNFIRYYIFLFSALLGNIFLPSFYQLANVRMAKDLRRSNEINVSKLFKSGDNPKSLYTMILSFFLSLFIFLGGVLVIALVGGLLFLLAGAFNVLLFQKEQLIVYIIFLIPAGIGLIIFMVEFLLSLSPRAYIVDTVNNVGASDVLNKSFTSMKKGKLTLLMLIFVPALIGFVISGAVLAVPTLIYIILGIENYIFISLSTILFIAAIIFILIIVPKLHTTANVGALSFFEDVVFDKYNDTFETKGVDIKNIKIKKFRVDSIEENLSKLFDETTIREPLKEDKKEKEVFVEKDIIKEVSQDELGNLVDTSVESEDETTKVENISDIQNEDQELDSNGELEENIIQEDLSTELTVKEEDKKVEKPKIYNKLKSLFKKKDKPSKDTSIDDASKDSVENNDEDSLQEEKLDSTSEVNLSNEDTTSKVEESVEENSTEPLAQEKDKKLLKPSIFAKIKSSFKKKEKTSEAIPLEDSSKESVDDNLDNQEDNSINITNEDHLNDTDENDILNNEEVLFTQEESLNKIHKVEHKDNFQEEVEQKTNDDFLFEEKDKPLQEVEKSEESSQEEIKIDPIEASPSINEEEVKPVKKTRVKKEAAEKEKKVTSDKKTVKNVEKNTSAEKEKKTVTRKKKEGE